MATAVLEPIFPHRHNSDGSYDSICTRCFATVATAQNESELAFHESAHVCEPVTLYRFSQGLSPQVAYAEDK
jgi:hypothetical protein